MLSTASREYDRQQRLTALAVAEAQRLSTRGPLVVARTVQTYQAAAVALSLQALTGILDEQGIDPAQDATVTPTALLTPSRDLAGMFTQAASETAFTQLVQTFVRDADRTARAIDAATRPAVTAHVRYLRPPSCSRCAILAGRVYRFSEGFQRHPQCDCGMMPTNEAAGRHLVTNPQAAFSRGQIQGLSKADVDAVAAGADLGQVVNVRRKAAGLTVGSSVTVRAGRLTPQACLSFASDRAGALDLLRRYGYIT